MTFDTTLTDDELHRLLTTARPDWGLCDATASPSEAGHHTIYRLTVDTSGGQRDCYLKATPEGKASTVDLEARILALLDAETDLPTPAVYGVVDSHDDLPTPAVLTEAMPGTATSRIDPGALSGDEHRAIGRQTGRLLAELHDIDAVDGYGMLTRADDDRSGGSPSGRPDAVAVADPSSDWRARLDEWTADTLDSLDDTRFADLKPTAERAMADGIEALDGPFEPVLARIDNSLENVLTEDGSVTALLDWEFTMATTPGYDLVHTATSLAGGPFVFAPSVTDRRSVVATALLDGYCDATSEAVRPRLRANWSCYERLFALRVMANLDTWYAMVGLDDEVDAAASALRTEVDA